MLEDVLLIASTSDIADEFEIIMANAFAVNVCPIALHEIFNYRGYKFDAIIYTKEAANHPGWESASMVFPWVLHGYGLVMQIDNVKKIFPMKKNVNRNTLEDDKYLDRFEQIVAMRH